MGKIHWLIQCYLPGAVSSKLSPCHRWEERVCVTLPPFFEGLCQPARVMARTAGTLGLVMTLHVRAHRAWEMSSDLEVSLGAWVGSPWPLLATLGRRGPHWQVLGAWVDEACSGAVQGSQSVDSHCNLIQSFKTALISVGRRSVFLVINC